MLLHLFLSNNLQSFFILCLHYFNHSIKSVNTFIIPFAGASILLSFCSVIGLWQWMMVFWEAFICRLLFIYYSHHTRLSLCLSACLCLSAWCPSHNFALEVDGFVRVLCTFMYVQARVREQNNVSESVSESTLDSENVRKKARACRTARI